MKRYLLDTNVLSALAPGKADKPVLDPALMSWIRANTDALFISAITAIEIEAGVLKLGRTSPGRWHARLSNWFALILNEYGDRILAADLPVARVASLMTDRSKAKGEYPGFPDVVIAATAVAYDLILLTRNLKHFDSLGVPGIDPFERLPS